MTRVRKKRRWLGGYPQGKGVLLRIIDPSPLQTHSGFLAVDRRIEHVGMRYPRATAASVVFKSARGTGPRAPLCGWRADHVARFRRQLDNASIADFSNV